jgi:uncharacterized membrane protein
MKRLSFGILIAVFTLSACSGTQSSSPLLPAGPGLQPASHSGITTHAPASKPRADSGNLLEFDAPKAATSVSPACAPNCGTLPEGINDEGAIVGFYTDANVVPHGFVRSPGGAIFPFDAPGAGLGAGLDEGTVAYGISDLGAIVGYYQDSQYVFHGFVRGPDGHFAPVDALGAGTGAYQGTVDATINLEGETAGYYYDSAGTAHGFVRSPGGQITPFDAAPSANTYVPNSNTINAEGAVVGYYFDSSGTGHGYVRWPSGNVVTIDPQGSVLTLAASINAQGAITGYYFDSTNAVHGFVRAPSGKITPFDAPNAGTALGPLGFSGTGAFSINAPGDITGAAYDNNDVEHGFVRYPNGTFATFDARGAGTQVNQGTRPQENNAFGIDTGYWIDSGGLNHGFVWSPSL